MDKIRKITILLLIAVMTLTIAACHININTRPAEKPEEKQEEQKPKEEVKDPVEDVMKAVVPPEDFEPAGEYEDETSQRAVMEITPEGEDFYHVEISWAGSATEKAVWTFNGTFDYDSGMLTFKDCRKDIDSFDENQGEKEEIIYEGGTGALMYYEDGLHWQDDQEDAGKDCHFIKISDLENVVIEDE